MLRFNNHLGYTSWQLLVRPGHAIREYLQGRRVRHFKPTAYVIVLAGIYGILSHFFDLHVIDPSPAFAKIGFEDTNEWIIMHYAWIALLSVPLFAVGSFIAFRRERLNFAEHFVINAFLAGQRFLVLIAALPLLYLLGIRRTSLPSAGLSCSSCFCWGPGRSLSFPAAAETADHRSHHRRMADFHRSFDRSPGRLPRGVRTGHIASGDPTGRKPIPPGNP